MRTGITSASMTTQVTSGEGIWPVSSHAYSAAKNTSAVVKEAGSSADYVCPARFALHAPGVPHLTRRPRFHPARCDIEPAIPLRRKLLDLCSEIVVPDLDAIDTPRAGQFAARNREPDVWLTEVRPAA
jgi:hypothetical protein